MSTTASRSKRQALAAALAGALTWLLAACASQVEVQATFPDPLVDRLPVRVGILFDAALTEYEHYEEIPDQITWTIRLGEANRNMLEKVLGGMFETMVAVDSIPNPDNRSAFDGVIKPELEKFEFEVPVRGRDNFAEVWMQYRLKLYEPDGDLIADWPVSGYGKSEIMRNNREESLNQAVEVAMREAGAVILTQFPTQPQVEYWLQQAQNTLQSAGNGFLTSTDDNSLPTPPRSIGADDD